MVNGVPEAIKKSKAKKIFVMNLMTKYGQTTGYGTKKHFEELEKYLGKGIVNFILINSEKPRKKVLDWYDEYDEHPVKDNLKASGRYEIIKADLLRDVVVKKSEADVLRRSIIRHDPNKLAIEVTKLIKS